MSTATTAGGETSHFSELKRQVMGLGLLDRQPAYYVFKLLSNAGIYALGVVLLLWVEAFWAQMLVAGYWGFAFVQTAEMAHDAAHHQISSRGRLDELLGVLHLDLLLGASLAWWKTKHDTHHRYPNQLGLDPDITFGVVAFHEDQLPREPGFRRFAVKHQAFLYPFWVMLMPWGMRATSIKTVLGGKSRHPRLETFFLIVHYLAYPGLVFFALSPLRALAFLVVHHACTGLYMSAIFAPNHKGMPILPRDTPMGFVERQVITARNVRGGLVADFFYGGLNYQIEHHLFPSMPRNRLKEARLLIKESCERHQLPYHETGALASTVEIFRDLHAQSAPLRS